MHLLLIRHAESVDNVANLYGGSRDAPLTAHGALQARRLASSLSRLNVRHVFASNLQRASQTAQAICDACNVSAHEVKVVQVPYLREKHFGTWEGVKFASSSKRPLQTGAETSESINNRAHAFLDVYLGPLLSTSDPNSSVVIVSHGIMLNALTQALVSKFSFGDSPSLTQLTARLPWSNTGYLHLEVARLEENASTTDVLWSNLAVDVSRVNFTAHLNGLRKTRGGIGSAAYDKRQRTIEKFLAAPRKRKAEDPLRDC
ncbi:uncharacterized protein UV8b_06017 [Ustilaginoidea virens]|uniref:Phosphoglycerate mutase family protein n=1 Tax=Ustilaginoidea virens TaxID=1159556 RepID=A0A8E5HUG3_USTVR|nr:uncharacterized protein UV8b_06017 [Ustilaginoidea virens]QUC21774.1 hypothetical protein UV8b_06017 [Ustilaginoidea virens]